MLFVMMRTFVSAYFESGETTGKVGEALLLSAYHLPGAVTLGFCAGWISKTLEPLEPIRDVCFFTLAGASLHLDSMMEVGGLALVSFASRFVGKGLVARV